jgi:dihydrofolate synthase/folylpolyglutamate synthase
MLAELEPKLAVSSGAVTRGFAALRWPARVEVLGEAPWLVIDGAHNVASAHALAETLRTCFPATSRTLIFGTTRDKDLHGQLRALLPLFDQVIATRYVQNPRFVPPEAIAQAVLAIDGRTARVMPDPASALDCSLRISDPRSLVCVTGSLFLAAEARAIALGQEPILARAGLGASL